jgi:hypothetical protein
MGDIYRHFYSISPNESDENELKTLFVPKYALLSVFSSPTILFEQILNDHL